MLEHQILHRLHIFTLSAFAFAQPLYDLLGKNAEFFPIRNNKSIDILALTAILSLLMPAAIIFILELIKLAHKGVWRIAYIIAFTLLFAIITLPVLKEIPAISRTLMPASALSLGAVFAYLCVNKQAAQLFLTYLSPAALIFPLLFLLNSQVTYLLFPPTPPEVEVTEIKSETPIVMIIFDELPVSTLISGRDKIDEKLFPGFAALAGNATWYTNAISVAEYTIQSVPSILTGNIPIINLKHEQSFFDFYNWLNIPTFQQYPHNLFTALGTQYDFRVFETVTSLCPEQLCKHTHDISMGISQRFSDLLNDLLMVYLHIALPNDITSLLPRIDMGWSDFVANNQETVNDRVSIDVAAMFQNFVDSLTLSDRPSLYFHHTILPHTPWIHLPSGKVYESLNYSLSKNEDADIREPYQRHILQTMFADRLLSKAINKLEQEDIYDNVILIVTADHGTSFIRNEDYRVVNQNNYSDIMDVPLFIKYSEQKKGLINSNRIQLIDIIPLLFHALGTKYPWETDGKYQEERTSDKLPIVNKAGTIDYINYDPDKKFESLGRKTSIIGNNGIQGIYGGQKYWHLIGQQIDTKCAHEITGAKIIDKEQNFSDVNITTNKIPASLTITLPTNPLSDNEILTVCVNSNIAAAISPDMIPVTSDYLYTMIDPKQITSGNNDVHVYALDTSNTCNHGQATVHN